MASAEGATLCLTKAHKETMFHAESMFDTAYDFCMCWCITVNQQNRSDEQRDVDCTGASS